MRPDDPNYPPSWIPQRGRERAPALELAGMTVAETVRERLYPALGAFDVFMIVASRGGVREPAIGNVSACDALRPHGGGGGDDGTGGSGANGLVIVYW
jgi:hypothetical protein